MNLLQSLLLAVALPLFMLLNPMGALAAELFICEGQPLSAEVYNGAVDAAGIPNSNGGTVPGAFILIRWGELSLQLPRTNNAGLPSVLVSFGYCHVPLDSLSTDAVIDHFDELEDVLNAIALRRKAP